MAAALYRITKTAASNRTLLCIAINCQGTHSWLIFNVDTSLKPYTLKKFDLYYIAMAIASSMLCLAIATLLILYSEVASL